MYLLKSYQRGLARVQIRRDSKACYWNVTNFLRPSLRTLITTQLSNRCFSSLSYSSDWNLRRFSTRNNDRKKIKNLKDYVTEALKRAELDKHTGTVITILTASDWNTKMLEDPEKEQFLVTALQKPWAYYREKETKLDKLGNISKVKMEDLYHAAETVAMILVDFSKDREGAHFVSLKKPKPASSIRSWPSNSEFSDFYKSSAYIDKTGLFPKLIDLRHVFISRPRRFGKSLLVSTLQELFQGNKVLFKGLAIEDMWDWDVMKYPVIKLDFSGFAHENFANGLTRQLISSGKQYGLKFSNTTRLYDDVFDELFDSLSALNESEGRESSCVVLIDEYDKPVIDILENSELVEKNLLILQTFLSMVKAKSPFFSLVTGSSRLARSSGDNNRKDISFRPEFNTLCGFTADEIQRNLGSIMGSVKMENLKDWYNGYCFGGSEGIYNPFSIAKCLVKQELRPFWVQSGTSTLLGRYCISPAMKEFVSELILSDGIDTSFDNLLEVVEIADLGKTSASLRSLFLDAGYITIIPSTIDGNLCKLGIPNKEIQNHALPRLTLGGLLRCNISDVESHPHYVSLRSALKARNIEDMYDALFSLFQVLGYSDGGKIDKCEDHYQRLLQSFFLSFCLRVQIEQRTSIGKCDLFAEFTTWTLLVELKVLHGEKDIHTSHSKLKETIDEAFEQIDKRFVTGLVPDVVAVMVVNSATRTLYSRESLGNTIFYRNMKE